MLKIRLKRFGRKKQPSYRIIVIDSKKRRDGKPLEEVGYYNPLSKQIKLNVDQIEQRIRNGAKLTKTVSNILVKTKEQNTERKER